MSNILGIQNIVEKDILQETDWISNGYPINFALILLKLLQFANLTL